jgi:hypothetical protein
MAPATSVASRIEGSRTRRDWHEASLATRDQRARIRWRASAFKRTAELRDGPLGPLLLERRQVHAHGIGLLGLAHDIGGRLERWTPVGAEPPAARAVEGDNRLAVAQPQDAPEVVAVGVLEDRSVEVLHEDLCRRVSAAAQGAHRRERSRENRPG